MEESGGEDREGRDEISLLAVELIQLTVKGSKAVPNSKPTLICTVWTGKLYNPESFRAQMRSIWKTKKNFEIQRVGQNLFLIVFELEEDLESILEGRPWLFHKSLILFNRLSQEMERDQISMTSSPFWIKIDLHLPEFDKKDLMHAIGVTFGGLSDLKYAILATDSELVWMSGNHYVEEFSSQALILRKCGFLLFWLWKNGAWTYRLYSNNTFPEDLAEKIIGIPLAEDPHDDFRVWSAEASGKFTVRSSYKLLQNIEDDPRAYALQEGYKEFY